MNCPLKISIENSNTPIYRRIINCLTNSLRAKGHSASIDDPSRYNSIGDYLQSLEQDEINFSIITNPFGLKSHYLDEQDVFVFELLQHELIFLHHDHYSLGPVKDEHHLKQLISAYQRTSTRSHHFCIETSNCDELRGLGLTNVHSIRHASEFNLQPTTHGASSHASFVGHVLGTEFNISDPTYSHLVNRDYWSRICDLSRHMQPSAQHFAEQKHQHEDLTSTLATKAFYLSQLHALSLCMRGEIIKRAGNHPIHIFGGDPAYLHGSNTFRTLGLNNVVHRPPTSQAKECSDIYNGSFISINITPFQFDTTVINRVIDIGAAGGFPLTDWKDDLPKFTSTHQEISFRSPEELEHKIGYYLHPDHQKERVEICHTLYDEIHATCTYDSVVDDLLSKLFQRVQPSIGAKKNLDLQAIAGNLAWGRAPISERQPIPTTTTLTLADGVRVIVPDSIERITTYVLEEQQDWFEDEIKVVRALLKPGQTVIDIGANLGLYALSMAKVVGKQGRVIAFEPAPDTAALLEASARLNGMAQLEVDQRGVGASSGEARLVIGADSELNHLTEADPTGSSTVTVSLTSLDDWATENGHLGPIAFIKIDAKDQELNIIQGAQRLLREQTPLILYEVKHRSTLHLELVEAFAGHGYTSYRLLPGPRLLKPFDAGEPVDNYLLNLFCCKEETAIQLEQEGWLVRPSQNPLANELAAPEPADRHGWRIALGRFPYAMALQHNWLRWELEEPGEAGALRSTLALYALSSDRQETPRERAQALHQCVKSLHASCSSGGSPLQLASLARAAQDAGERVLALEALDSLINALPWMEDGEIQQPFLAPCARFDTVPPGESLQQWLMVAAIEAHESLRHYSSFFTGALLRERLSYALGLGIPSAPLQRRLNLIERRFPSS